ncbi:MAG: LamG domain-containing protein, partial [Planctomycetota bacterium]
SFYPDHTHGRIEPGDTRQLAFDIRRPAGGLDDAFDSLRFALVRDYLTRSQRYHIPEVHAEVPVRIDVASLPAPTRDRALRLNGQDQAVLVPSEVASVPQGPFTIECWFRPDSFSGRVGLLAKTQNSEYSVFVSNGTPSFSVHLGGEYRSARTRDRLETGRWQHIAGVYDGATVTLFVDGQIRSRTPVDPGWARTTNELPLFIGADPGGRGAPMSFAHGQIDEVRLTAGAVYSGTFAPERRLPAVGGAVFHYRFDRLFGTAVINAGPEQHGSRALGAPRLVDAAAPEGTRSR